MEGLEEAGELPGRDEPAGVGDGENGMLSLGTGCDVDSAGGDVVPGRFGERVGGESLGDHVARL